MNIFQWQRCVWHIHTTYPSTLYPLTLLKIQTSCAASGLFLVCISKLLVPSLKWFCPLDKQLDETFICHNFNEVTIASSDLPVMILMLCATVFTLHRAHSHAMYKSYLNTVLVYVAFPYLSPILWYLRWLQSSGLQRYLMLIVHMKENLFEVWAFGNWRSLLGGPHSLLRQPRQPIPQFLVSGDF